MNNNNVPITALTYKSRKYLSQALNCKKVLPSPNGLPRDWRGFSQLTGVTCPTYCSPDPTSEILLSWEKTDPTMSPCANINNLEEFLKDLDRWDVFYDLKPLLEEDIKKYEESLESTNNFNCTQKIGGTDDAVNLLTYDDIDLQRKGLGYQKYDAFLLFTDEDRTLAERMTFKLEKDYGLKLCLKDRDLIGGTFEHKALIQLVSERCDKLIPIISKEFLQSGANQFLLSFAQALGIEQQQRKIVPVTFDRKSLPPCLRMYHVLIYSESELLNFWDKLYKSLRRIPQTKLPLRNNIAVEHSAPTTSRYAVEKFNNDIVQKKTLNYDTKTAPFINSDFCKNSMTVNKIKEEKLVEEIIENLPIPPTTTPKSLTKSEKIKLLFKRNKKKKKIADFSI